MAFLTKVPSRSMYLSPIPLYYNGAPFLSQFQERKVRLRRHHSQLHVFRNVNSITISVQQRRPAWHEPKQQGATYMRPLLGMYLLVRQQKRTTKTGLGGDGHLARLRVLLLPLPTVLGVPILSTTDHTCTAKTYSTRMILRIAQLSGPKDGRTASWRPQRRRSEEIAGKSNRLPLQCFALPNLLPFSFVVVVVLLLLLLLLTASSCTM